MKRYILPIALGLAMVGCGGESNQSSAIDNQQPEVSQVFPVDNYSLASQTLEVHGTVSDNEGVASVVVSLGEQVVAAQLTGTGFTANLTLAAGNNAVVITITDTSGNQIELQRSVILDQQGPVVQSVFPTQAHAVQSQISTVKGLVEDAQGVASVTVIMGDQSTLADLHNNGFSARVSWQPGDNQYQLKAVDNLGNETLSDHQVYFGKQLSAGGAHSGILKQQQLYTWGRNNKGQTGLGFISDPYRDIHVEQHPTTPNKMVTETRFVSLAFAQNTSAALSTEGEIWTWGAGDKGQLGQGVEGSVSLNEDDSSIPVKIDHIDDAIAVVRGYRHTLVLHRDNTVSSFGTNTKGELGDGTTEHRDRPVKLGLSNIVQLAAGGDFSLALDGDGRIWVWGSNGSGQLGLGIKDRDAHPTPVQLPNDQAFESVVAGKGHVLALTQVGQVYGWGLNFSSQVGWYNFRDTSVSQWERYVISPQLLPWFSDAHAVWANGNQSFVERSDGRVYPWGQNLLGTLGIEQDGDIMAPASSIFGFNKVIDLGNGALHTLGLRQGGHGYSWGWSFQGSLGGGNSTIDRWAYRVPTLISLPDA